MALARKMNKRARLIAAILVAVAAVGVLAVSAKSFYDVEAKGHLLPYKSGEVYRIEVLGSFTMYADGDSKLNPDTLKGIVLVIAASVALFAALLLRFVRSRPRLVLFYSVSALGIGFLALDELFSIHETIGHNMRFLADLPGVERPDDVIFASYAIPALAFLVYFRDVLLASRRGSAFLGAGIVLFGASVLSDVAGLGAETAIEMLGTIAILAGFAMLIAEHVSQAVGRPGAPGQRPVGGSAGEPVLDPAAPG